MEKILPFFCVLVVNTCFGQTFIGVGGNTITNNSGSISFSIGEAVTSTLNDAQKVYSQGFIQPKYSILTGVKAYEKLNLDDLSLYPNPVIDVINVKVDKTFFKYYRLFNLEHLVHKDAFNGTTIDVSGLIPGIYFIQFFEDETKFSQLFKFIKK